MFLPIFMGLPTLFLPAAGWIAPVPPPPAATLEVSRISRYARHIPYMYRNESGPCHFIFLAASMFLDQPDEATATVVPQLWQPASGIFMTNDISETNPEEAVSCFALSKNDSYVMSASGGKISLFNMMTFETMTTFMPPPPATMHLLDVHETQISLYEAQKLECLKQVCAILLIWEKKLLQMPNGRPDEVYEKISNTTVWWDTENVPLRNHENSRKQGLPNLHLTMVRPALERLCRKFNFPPPSEIFAVGHINQLSKKNRRLMAKSFLTIVDVTDNTKDASCRKIRDMMVKWRQSAPAGAHCILITGDKGFKAIVEEFQKRHPIIIVSRSNIHDDLLEITLRHVYWDTVI